MTAVMMPSGMLVVVPDGYVGDRPAEPADLERLAGTGRLDPVPDLILTWCRDCDRPAVVGCSSGRHRMGMAPAYRWDPTRCLPAGHLFYQDAANTTGSAHQCSCGQRFQPPGLTDQPAMSVHDRVLAEIAAERGRHRDVHGWDERHDDRLREDEWVWLLTQRTTTLLAPTLTFKDRRRALIELCAIAEAAIEAHDRRVT